MSNIAVIFFDLPIVNALSTRKFIRFTVSDRLFFDVLDEERALEVAHVERRRRAVASAMMRAYGKPLWKR